MLCFTWAMNDGSAISRRKGNESHGRRGGAPAPAPARVPEPQAETCGAGGAEGASHASRPLRAMRSGRAGAGAAGQANDGPSVSDAKRTIEDGHFSPGAAASGSDGAGAVARLAADTAVYV